MPKYCADVVVRTWLTDDELGTYKSSRVVLTFDAIATIEDLTAGLDAAIQDWSETLQAVYLSGGTAELATRQQETSPLVMGIEEC